MNHPLLKATDDQIMAALTATQGHRSNTARQLGITTTQLMTRVKALRNKGVAIPEKPDRYPPYKLDDNALQKPLIKDDDGANRRNTATTQVAVSPERVARAEVYVRQMVLQLAAGNIAAMDELRERAIQDLMQNHVTIIPLADETLADCNVPLRMLEKLDEYADAVYVRDLKLITTKQLLAIPGVGTSSVDDLWRAILDHASSQLAKAAIKLSRK